MLIQNLATTFKCYSAIGNSLELKTMIQEALKVFVSESYSSFGTYYIEDEEIISFGKIDNFDTKEFVKYKQSVNLIQESTRRILILRLEIGSIYLVSKNLTADYNFFVAMFESLISKINISINSCLNVEKLKKTNEELSVASKAKDTFLANMSHEIRTPLNAIIGFSEILSNSNDLSQKDKKQAQVIQTSALSLLSIINDVLDISKIKSGHFEINKDQTDLYYICEHVVELFSKKASQKHIKLIFNLDYKIPSCVFTDGLRLRQVLSNLLSNAIKFTPNYGKIFFNISLVEQNNKNCKINFEIEDTGIGIQKEKIDNIFKPFIQIDNESNREYEGTGLGLSISSYIIESLNSRIRVESEINKGTKFYFDLFFDICNKKFTTSKSYCNNSYNFLVTNEKDELFHYVKKYLNILGSINLSDKPYDILICTCSSKDIQRLNLLRNSNKSIPILLLFEHEDEAKVFQTNDNEQVISLPFYASKVNDAIQELLKKSNKISKKKIDIDKYMGNILVAEDNEANQELLSYLLDEMSVKYVIKPNGLEAFEEYKKNNYDLILMDINMPVMDGIDAFKNIREYESKNSLCQKPVVALTANAIKGDKEKFLEYGMNDYLSKPINLNELKNIFSKYLKKISKEENVEINESKFKKDIDVKKVMETLGISENIAKLLITKFKKDIKIDLEELRNLILRGSFEEIKNKAHYIKNSCLNMNLKNSCEQLSKFENKQMSVDEAYLLYTYIEKDLDF